MARAKKQYIVSKPDYKLINAENPNQRKEFYKALHFVQHELQPKQLNKATVLYAKNHDDYDHKLINVLADCWTAVAGKYAHMVNQGAELPEDIQAGLDRHMDELVVRAKVVQAEKKAAAKAEKEKEKNTGPVLTMQDRMRMQAEEVGALFDQWIDDLMLGKVKSVTKEMDPSAQMTLMGFKAGQARWVRSFYEPELAHIQEVIAGKDKQLVEGYSNVLKSSLLRVEKLLDKIISATNVIETMAKAQRKPRKKKAMSAERLVANVKYCIKHDETGVASVNPVDIIGAKEVWVYNTKTRKLGKYIAKDPAGLTIKGTTIQDFSADSIAKNLRKPKEQLKDFMASGKVKLRKFLPGIKAVDVKLNGRLNKDVVILKVFK